MKNSLLWRYAVIAVVLAAAIFSVSFWPLLQGIDLAGGTSLLYELDLSKVTSTTTNPQQLAEQVIDVLKRRVDPSGQKNLIWRVIGGKRIQVQMPLPGKETLAARKALDDAEAALYKTSLKQSEIQSAISKTGEARTKAIDALAPEGTDRHKLLVAYAEAQDALNAANAAESKYSVDKVPPEVLDEKVKAEEAVASAKDAIDRSNVDVATLKTVVEASDNPKNKAAQAELQKLLDTHKAQQKEIATYLAAHRKLISLNGGGVEDPADLQRMITSSGVLDFRITVSPEDLGVTGNSGPTDAYEKAIQSLKDHGPNDQLKLGEVTARWFQIDPASTDNFIDPVTKSPLSQFIVQTWAGQPYVLCWDDAVHTLTHAEGKRSWSVSADKPYFDPGEGGEVMPFSMDAVGASYLGEMTGSNQNKPMCILLDDKAITAPRINNRISDHGVITFGSATPTRTIQMIQKEAEGLKQIMDAGSLPATLQREPISVVEITPDMGKDNIDAGIHSAVYAVIAVVAFMLLYYTITGAFADIALMFNLLLVLAAMAFLEATFTLPGIAGLVLTLGMAVDANILINERIREELHKGASLWMAVRQGYDKVFWTIFDANLTCSLTSIVLIYVGSEEVKGFGVTLLIGLAIHMFTALFVTRTLIMTAIRWGVVRAIDDHSVGEYIREILTFTWLRSGHWPFMRVVTVTNFDWIGKRHIFWVVSSLITIAGIVAFVMRGDDKYDIEFRGGTQVTFQLKESPGGGYLQQDQVRKRIENLADEPGLADLRSARVYGVGKPEEHRFEMQTTIANPAGDPTYVQKTLLTPLANAFKDVLDITPAETITGDKPGDVMDQRQLGTLMDRGLVRPIKAGALDQNFADAGISGIPNRDVTDFMGGTAIVLENISPPETAAKLEDRIRAARQSPDSHVPYRSFKIIPVTAVASGGGAASAPASGPAATGAAASEGSVSTVAATEDDKRPLTRAVMVSVDPSKLYNEQDDSLWQDNAASEWGIVRQAMERESLFAGVTTFDAVVAGQAKMQALLAIVLSLILIVIYVWIRFGGIRYGIGAIMSLVHDAVVAVAATVLSGVAYKYIFHNEPNWFLLSDFKINLTMIAAYLTIIGYSVNDTIVIFDRVRELRGKAHVPLTSKLVNDAINQCFGRTIWTTFTVFIVVLIMYVWGGEGVRGFSFAMLIGVLTGAYSTLAIASPMLLTTAGKADREPERGLTRANPFRKEQAAESVE
ncbi:MAG TPA: protein translocase subunit SecD [Phycisphaerae bacterium]|nr:protein translocase subunit SecD [Phycisphaerae bacterium]